MPTPIGHSLIAYLIHHYLFQKRISLKWIRIILLVGIANLADLDFVPGFLVGEPNRYHHGISHSFGFLLLLMVVFYIVEKRFFSAESNYWFWFGVLYLSHVVADFFAMDTRFPYGEPLLWPLTTQYYLFPYPFLLDIQRSDQMGKFFPSLVQSHNVLAVLREISFFFILWLIFMGVQIARNRIRKRTH